MKLGKFACAIAAALVMSASFGLAACGGNNSGDTCNHVDQNGDNICDLCGDPFTPGEQGGEEHVHSYSYRYDDTEHWQKCLCGDEKAGSREAHVDENGNKMCDVCGYYMEEGHIHEWEWKYDEGDYHWQECVKDQVVNQDSRGLHCDDDKNGKCDVCGAPVAVEDQGGGDEEDDPPATPGDDGTITVHYHNMNGWTSVNAYSWDKAKVTKYLGEWSGKPATNDGANWWSITYEVPAGQSAKDLWIIFNNAGAGGGSKTQTGDINLTGKVYGGQSWISKDEQPYPTQKAALKAENGVSGPHEHSYSSAWESDQNTHWHPSICEHTGLKKEEAEHSFQEGSYVCSVCGYIKGHPHVAGEWVNNASSHWKNCTLCGQKLPETEAAHSGVPCDICGYDVAVSGALKYQYDKATDSYFVIGYDNDEITSEVRIPAEYNHMSVTKITNKAFMGCEKIHSVIIPDSVTCIDIYSFCGCAYLTGVSLGGGVQEIGMAAFENCSALAEIVFPASLTKLGVSAFENTSITAFTVGKNLVEIGAFAFRTKKLDKVTFEVTSGWKVCNRPFSEESEDVDVSNTEKNALMFFYAKFQEDYPPTNAIIVKWAEDHGSDLLKFLANYTWIRG